MSIHANEFAFLLFVLLLPVWLIQSRISAHFSFTGLISLFENFESAIVCFFESSAIIPIRIFWENIVQKILHLTRDFTHWMPCRWCRASINAIYYSVLVLQLNRTVVSFFQRARVCRIIVVILTRLIKLRAESKRRLDRRTKLRIIDSAHLEIDANSKTSSLLREE